VYFAQEIQTSVNQGSVTLKMCVIPNISQPGNIGGLICRPSSTRFL